MVESLLVFSDVHLGSDLNDRVQPEGAIRRSEDIDRDLVSFLAHYRDEVPAGERWRLVIAGDFIDFIGMSIEPDAPLATELTVEERQHGLGNASDHACAKLRRVALRHADVFAALAAFVARGHGLTLVHGNHDVEFHWDDVKDDFRELLLSHTDGIDRDAFTKRIDFCAWFFRWKGIAYVEHGHQYDPFCATENVMAPLSPLDPRRVVRGFCDVLLRFVVRPTKGMTEFGHEALGLLDYVAFGMKLGFGGMLHLGVRFVEAIRELFRLRRANLTDAANTLRLEHHRRVRLLARGARISMRRLRALLALQSPPITRTVRGILASLLLDRLALALIASLVLAVTMVLGAHDARYFAASTAVVLAWFFAHRHLAKQRSIDPGELMAERATHLARLLPAAFIVMGHTHEPRVLPVNDGASTYINLGSWTEDEPAAGKTLYRAARTHLVIHVREGTPVAELRAWEPTGPRRFTG